jgi:hypothetical protein
LVPRTTAVRKVEETSTYRYPSLRSMLGRHPSVSQLEMTSGLNVRLRKLELNIAISDNAVGQFERGGFALHVSALMATKRVSAATYGYSVPVLW